MATYEQLMDAARRADAQGNEADARRLLELAARARTPEPADDRGFLYNIADNLVGFDDGRTTTGERIGSWLNRAGESLTAGLIGDEVSAATHAPIKNAIAMTGLTSPTSYEDELARYRANEEDLGFAGQLSADLAGGALGAIATGGAGILPQASTLIGRTGYGLAAGAGLGGIQGFMEGEGGLSDRLSSGASGALVGGAFGAATPALIAGASAAGGAVRDMVTGGFDTVAGRASQGRANRALARTMDRAGMDRDAVARALAEAASEGQDAYRVMDALGKPGQRRAAGIVRGGEEGADELARFLAQRQIDQSDRVGDLVRDQLGFNASGPQGVTALVPEGHVFRDTPADVLARGTRSASQTESALEAARRTNAGIDYNAARANAAPVDIRGVVESIDSRLGPIKEGAPITGDGIDAAFQKYRNRLIANTPEGDIELSDFQRVLGVKQDLQDEIQKALRAGENNKASQLTGLTRDLDAALEAASPDYRTANDAFRDSMRVAEALTRGGEMARGGRAVDNLSELQGMNPTQRSAARIGYGDARLSRMEATGGETTNRMLPFNSTKAQQEMGALARDPQLWERIRARENQMWQTQNRAMGGSMTADNLADVADNGLAADALKSVSDIFTGNFRTGAGNAIGAVGRIAGGMNAPTREIIARALMSGDASVLDQAAKAQMQAARNQLILESALMAAQRGSYE